MSMYAEQHPLLKQAALPGVRALGKNIRSNTNLANLRSTVMGKLPEILALSMGLTGGAYLGNKAYNNTIPPVKSLPRLNHEPLVEPSYQQPTSVGVK